MVMLRTFYAVGILVVAIWLLRSGLPLGAVVVVALAIVVRRSVESRHLARRVT